MLDKGTTMRACIRAYVVLLLVGLPLGLAGCGGGTILSLVLSRDSSGGSSSPSTPTAPIQDVEVAARRSPATIRFRLVDPDSEPHSIEILLRDGRGALTVAKLVAAGMDQRGNLVTPETLGLASSPQGIEHTKRWDFENQLGPGLHPDVELIVRTSGANPTIQALAVGNDPPALAIQNGLAIVDLPGKEAVGAAPLTFQALDSSADLVELTVEYAIVDGLDFDAGDRPAEGDFQPATAAAGAGRGFASPGGAPVEFVWDTLGDLGPASNHQVTLRATLHDFDDEGDVLATSEAALTHPFEVDNNAPPVITLDATQFAAASDERSVIPIALDVCDAEGDPVDVILQWTPEGVPFPPLPDDVGEWAAILADPLLRDEYRIAEELPLAFDGSLLLVPGDPQKLRLPALQGPLGPALRRARLEGRSIEIERTHFIPQSASTNWSIQPLVSPLAALPLDRGLTCLVVDRIAADAWSVKEIDTVRGNVVSVLAANLPGRAVAADWEERDRTLLVGVEITAGAFDWEIHRVDTIEQTDTLVTSGSSGDPLRSMLSLGPRACLLTLLDDLYLVDLSASVWPGGSPLTAATTLESPAGMVRLPGDDSRILIAERAADRITLIDLFSRMVTRLPLDPSDVPSPLAVRFDASGGCLLIITDADPGTPGLELRSLPFPGSADTDGDGFADPEVTLRADLSGATEGCIEVGFLNQVLVTLSGPSTADLFVGGGLQQVRRIVSVVGNAEVLLDAPLDPLPLSRAPWRIERPLNPVPAPPGGRRDVYYWDTTPLIEGGSLLLRAIPMDTDVGAPAETVIGKDVQPAIVVAPQFLPGAPGSVDQLSDLAVFDVDLDGDLDLVTASPGASALAVYWQSGPSEYTTPPSAVTAAAILAPSSVVIAHLGGNLDAAGNPLPDLLAADLTNDRLTISQQSARGEFLDPPIVLTDPAMQGPVAAIAADLSADGYLDVVAVHGDSVQLTIHRQTAAGFPLPGGDQVIDLSGLLVRPTGVASADIDQDGDLDLVVSDDGNGGNGSILLLPQGPSGFDLAQALRLAPPNFHPIDLTIADLDFDGDFDIVTANATDQRLNAFIQIGQGNFFPTPLAFGDATMSPQPTRVRVADLDRDGDLDVLSVNGDGSITLFYQGFANTLTASIRLPVGQLGGIGAVAAEITDINGDGRVDLIAGNAGTFSQDVLAILYQGGIQPFATPAESVGDALSTPMPAAVAFGDLDADGRLDVVASTCSVTAAPMHVVFFQDATGFTAVSWPAQGCPTAVAADDIDKDGLVDIVSANAADSGFGDNLTAYFATGPRTFDPLPVVIGDSSTSGDPRRVVLGDLDRDGDVDVGSVNHDTNNVTVFRQLDDGSFEAPVFLTHAQMIGPVDMATADLNQDGNINFAVACSGSQNVVVFLAGPNGPPESRLVLDAAALGMPVSVVIADLQVDGDHDLIVMGDAGMGVFLQVSPGQYSDLLPLSVDPSVIPGRSWIVDLDQDHGPDLLILDALNSQIDLLYGEGTLPR
jgi:hypothetical protein